MTRDLAQALMAEEFAAFDAARRVGNRKAAWRALEHAHIVAQPYLGLHLASHWAMLAYALRTRDGSEALGQCLRLSLVPLGAITGRLPVGNTGRSHVSAFRPMPIPQELLNRMDGKT